MRRLRTGRFIEMTLSWSIIASTRSGRCCAADVTIECLPGSALPDELRGAGYDLVPAGEGERILPAAITREFTLTSSRCV